MRRVIAGESRLTRVDVRACVVCPSALGVQDTAGQERFNSMHPSYYYRAHACILVFDVTRKVTYQHLQEWYNELQQHRPGLPTLVIANKIDGQREQRMQWMCARVCVHVSA
jgi:small GTP-binding protein